MQMRNLVLTLIALFAIPATATWAQHAKQSPQQIVFIFDASGSMWGQVQGENKIVIARRVLKNLVGELEDNAKVGLVAYGHRREQDCDDIEIIAPLAAIDRAALAQQIDALNPKGKTPITAAIRRTFEDVAGSGGASTIVLLTDGLETCDGDPCQTVAEAKARGVDFVLHIIGFDVAKEEVSQLECAAQAGGGLYLGADNATELAAALERSVRTPVDSSNAWLSIKAVADGELTDVLVHVFKSGTRNEVAKGRTYAAATTNPRLLPLSAGAYDVEIKALQFKGNVRQRLENVRIAAGDTLARVVDFSAGELSVKVTRNGELSDAAVNVYEAGTSVNVAGRRSYNHAKSNPVTFPLTPGSYDVAIKSIEISGDTEVKFEGVVVAGGQSVSRAHDFKSATLRVGATGGGELVDATVRVLAGGSSRAVAQGRTYTSASSNPKPFVVPPGKYRVVLKAVRLAGSPEKAIDVELAVGETVERMVDFSP